MRRKTYRAALEFKSDQSGAFEAVFATLGGTQPDHDGDLTIPGAFGEQAVTVEGWNHDTSLPIGKGRIFERGAREAVVQGQLFDTPAGRSHYEVLRNLGPQAEWSYTFQVVRSAPGKGPVKRRLLELDVWSVSPVTKAAGLGTRTVRLKSAGGGRRRDLDPLDVLAEVYSLQAWGRGSKAGAALEPAQARIALEELVVDAKIAEIAGRIKQRRSDHPMHYDHVRAQVARAWPDASEPYIEVQVDIALAAMARDLVERDRTLTDYQAAARVGVWARQAA